MRKTPKKFVAGNIYAANNAATRPPSPLAVNFKWTPCSIKSDFYKLSAANTHLLPNNQSQEALAGRRGMINHLEGHRELTRKDDLIINLKTQLQHECENLFDYTPISFHIVIPEGKQPSLEHFFKKFLSLYYVLNSTK